MKKIVAFDTLRFIASLLIIWYHTGINIYVFHKLEWSYFRATGLAVEIFLVLSGFLLAKSYYNKQACTIKDCDMCKQYFFLRIKRLYPEYIFAMLLCALMTNLFSHHISMNTFMLNVVMMAGWGGIPNIINGIWYVTVLFWGGCFLFNILALYKEKAECLIIPLITLLCLFYLVNHSGTLTGHQLGIEFNLLSKGTIRGILGLTVGIYTFQICKKCTAIRINNEKLINAIMTLLEFVSCFLLIKSICFRQGQDISDFNVYFYISYIIGLLYFKKEKLLKFLSFNFWGYVSDLSYTIYLTHLIVLEILRVHWPALSTMNPITMYTIVTILCILFGKICYELQKVVFQKLNKLFFGK